MTSHLPAMTSHLPAMTSHLPAMTSHLPAMRVMSPRRDGCRLPAILPSPLPSSIPLLPDLARATQNLVVVKVRQGRTTGGPCPPDPPRLLTPILKLKNAE